MKINSGLLMSSMLVLTSLSASDAAWAGNNKNDDKNNKGSDKSYSASNSSRGSDKDNDKNKSNSSNNSYGNNSKNSDKDKDSGTSYALSNGQNSGNGKGKDNDRDNDWNKGKDNDWNKGRDDDKDDKYKSYSYASNNGKDKDKDRDDDDHDHDHGWGRDHDEWKKDPNHSHGKDCGHDDDDDDWNPNKIYICHVTSSSTNPSVLIHVSTSAAAAHYAHGDPEEFTNLGNGKCAAIDPEPEPEGEEPEPEGEEPEPEGEEPAYIEMCAISDFTGVTNFWAIDYKPSTGEIDGFATGNVQLSGTVTGGGSLLTPGKLISLESGGVTAVSTTGSVVSAAVGVPWSATFSIVVDFFSPARTTTISFTEGCENGIGI